MQPLLDAAISYLPAPEEVPPPQVFPFGAEGSKGPKKDLQEYTSERCIIDQGSQAQGDVVLADPNGPLRALAFKVTFDEQRGGPVVFIRVYSGTLKSGQIVYNTSSPNRNSAKLKESPPTNPRKVCCIEKSERKI